MLIKDLAQYIFLATPESGTLYLNTRLHLGEQNVYYWGELNRLSAAGIHYEDLRPMVKTLWLATNRLQTRDGSDYAEVVDASCLTMDTIDRILWVLPDSEESTIATAVRGYEDWKAFKHKEFDFSKEDIERLYDVGYFMRVKQNE